MTSTRSITGAATSVAAVIGSPIRHSLSPVIHNAAFAACDLDWTYVAFDVVAADASAAIDATRTLGLAGLSVTMPLKQAVMSSLDGLTDVARRLGAVNCIFWDGDDLVGDNTDGAGFLTGLRRTWGVDLKGSHVAVIGSGGAAAAVVDALAGAGAGRIDVVARNPERASEVVGLGGGVARWASAEEAGRAHVIVNATPVGMSDVPGQPLSTAVHPELLVFDLVYHPLRTDWMRRCEDGGAKVSNGVPMLVGQAEIAFERWTGRAAPHAAIESAVADALGAA